MLWLGKKKARQGEARASVYDMAEVRGALDMAQQALECVRKRAEQSEGEAALVSLQLRDAALKTEKERLARRGGGGGRLVASAASRRAAAPQDGVELLVEAAQQHVVCLGAHGQPVHARSRPPIRRLRLSSPRRP